MTQNTIQDVEMRAQKLIDTKIRLFTHESFKDITKRQDIIGDMPDLEKYNSQIEKIRKLQNQKIGTNMRPCYEGPLLNFEQEQHLFRKMNYFKYRAKRLIASITTVFYSVDENGKSCQIKRAKECIPESKLERIESYFLRALQIRNQIAESNFRLVTKILETCQINFYRERNITDALISDAYFDVLKSVDYFDWTRGHKFSTYAIWVMKKNFFNDSKKKKKYAERFINIEANDTSAYVDDSSEILEYQETQNFVQQMLTFVKKEKIEGRELTIKEKLKERSTERMLYILENYFGLNGSEKRTLENISEEMGVTKERVRQLKEEGLTIIRKKIEELGITYEMGI